MALWFCGRQGRILFINIRTRDSTTIESSNKSTKGLSLKQKYTKTYIHTYRLHVYTFILSFILVHHDSGILQIAYVNTVILQIEQFCHIHTAIHVIAVTFEETPTHQHRLVGLIPKVLFCMQCRQF